jgi:hypothetical protein
VVIVLNRSWPAVSQICNFTLESPQRIDFILKSIPIVVINDEVNESSEYRRSRQDFPTPIKLKLVNSMFENFQF